MINVFLFTNTFDHFRRRRNSIWRIRTFSLISLYSIGLYSWVNHRTRKLETEKAHLVHPPFSMYVLYFQYHMHSHYNLLFNLMTYNILCLEHMWASFWPATSGRLLHSSNNSKIWPAHNNSYIIFNWHCCLIGFWMWVVIQ